MTARCSGVRMLLIAALSMSFLLWPCSSFLVVVTPRHNSFCLHDAATSSPSLPSPEESAKALSDYMAKAHEEKIKALASLESKYQQQVKVSYDTGMCVILQ